VAVLVAVPVVRRGIANGALKPAGRTTSPFSKQERGASDNGLNPHGFRVLHVSLGFFAVSGGMLVLWAQGALSLTPRFSGVKWRRGGPSTALAVSPRAALGSNRWETVKAVETPRQSASTPLKRGVNESPGHSTENSEEPSLASTLRLGATAAWASGPELGGGTRSETRNRNAPTGAEANAWTTRAWLLTGREWPHSYGKANSF